MYKKLFNPRFQIQGSFEEILVQLKFSNLCRKTLFFFQFFTTRKFEMEEWTKGSINQISFQKNRNLGSTKQKIQFLSLINFLEEVFPRRPRNWNFARIRKDTFNHLLSFDTFDSFSNASLGTEQKFQQKEKKITSTFVVHFVFSIFEHTISSFYESKLLFPINLSIFPHFFPEARRA